MTTLLLALLLQTGTTFHPGVNPPIIPVNTSGNALYVSLRGSGQDWVIQTAVGSSTLIRAFEIAGRDNMSLPKVDVSGNHATVSFVGNKTSCVYVEAPAGTSVIVVGKSDDDVLWSGTVVDGGIVSRGILLKELFPSKYFSSLLTMAAIPHERRLLMRHGPPTAATLGKR